MTKLSIKEWFYNKTESTSSSYNTFIDFERNEDGTAKIEDGYMTVFVQETISESEKAIQVVLSTGAVVGSGKGWKVWIPKSVIR